MDLDRAVREAVAREVAPILEDCKRMIAAIDRAEAALPIVLDKGARINVIALRARLDRLLSELETVEDRCVALARERWPHWWRT